MDSTGRKIMIAGSQTADGSTCPIASHYAIEDGEWRELPSHVRDPNVRWFNRESFLVYSTGQRWGASPRSALLCTVEGKLEERWDFGENISSLIVVAGSCLVGYGETSHTTLPDKKRSKELWHERLVEFGENGDARWGLTSHIRSGRFDACSDVSVSGHGQILITAYSFIDGTEILSLDLRTRKVEVESYIAKALFGPSTRRAPSAGIMYLDTRRSPSGWTLNKFGPGFEAETRWSVAIANKAVSLVPGMIATIDDNAAHLFSL